jgi:hypothetical protein
MADVGRVGLGKQGRFAGRGNLHFLMGFCQVQLYKNKAM